MDFVEVVVAGKIVVVVVVVVVLVEMVASGFVVVVVVVVAGLGFGTVPLPSPNPLHSYFDEQTRVIVVVDGWLIGSSLVFGLVAPLTVVVAAVAVVDKPPRRPNSIPGS